MLAQPRYHAIEHWRTVASDYPRATVGAWSVSTQRQAAGVYRMGEYGAFYYSAEPIDLTVLSEGNRVWFTDEPRQLYALAEIGLFRAHGTVVVGGLGLGLIHSFLKLNPNVKRVITIERATEATKLVWPHVRCGELIEGDFYEALPKLAQEGEQADTIILDFIFGYQDAGAWHELEEQRRFCREHFPRALFLEHGFQRQIDAEHAPLSTLLPPDTMFDRVVIVH